MQFIDEQDDDDDDEGEDEEEADDEDDDSGDGNNAVALPSDGDGMFPNLCALCKIVIVCMLMLCFIPKDLDIFGEPSAGSIVRKWRAQTQLDDERKALQDRVMNAEHHFKAI